MRDTQRVWRTIPALAATALTVTAACSGSGSPTTGTAGGCQSTVNSAASTSPSTGVLVLAGVFYTNESLTLGYSLLGHPTTVMGNAIANPSSSITFIALPSGTQTFTFEVNCTGPAPAYAAVHTTFPSATITIK